MTLPTSGTTTTIQPSQTISGISGIDLVAGVSYFLDVAPVSNNNDTLDFWDINSSGGTEAFDVLSAGSSAATPLPSTLALFAAGLGGLGLLGWRSKRKAPSVA
jgi:hypothetical protein